ncbi:MAG TPA: adenylate/guanylate cyclase domain-containing protein [Methylovirgula sp.]|nr:adenylate/guanylate cyclase domain-containing protein [Methylovirgula sp.]
MSGLGDIADWVTAAGLAGTGEAELLDGFCRRALAAGLPLARAAVIVDTLHPIHEGRAFRWSRDAGDGAETIEYGPTGAGEAAAAWRASSFYRLIETGGSLLRKRLAAGDDPEFPTVAAFAAEGMTDYLALINRFAGGGAIGEMDCVYSYWVSDAPGGFADAAVTSLVGLMPALALAVKCASLARIAATLVETYLGRDPGRRVLGGRIGRGAVEQIAAVLWYSDLRGFTHIADAAPPSQILALLNDYAEIVISAIHEHGGDVLKLIGDGTLAIFPSDEPAAACARAVAAEGALRQRLAALNRKREAAGLPVTEIYLGLHTGEVFYGNIGSRERLDFTVIGPAVNEVGRIAALCRSAERNVLLSADFAAAVEASGAARPVSVGRYALRGVERPQELFTLDRTATPGAG